MVVELLKGWQFIEVSQKRHYFFDGRSLCGRFYAVCTRMTHPPELEVAAFYNCVPCERKLTTGSSRKKHFSRK